MTKQWLPVACRRRRGAGSCSHPLHHAMYSAWRGRRGRGVLQDPAAHPYLHSDGQQRQYDSPTECESFQSAKPWVQGYSLTSAMSEIKTGIVRLEDICMIPGWKRSYVDGSINSTSKMPINDSKHLQAFASIHLQWISATRLASVISRSCQMYCTAHLRNICYPVAS